MSGKQPRPAFSASDEQLRLLSLSDDQLDAWLASNLWRSNHDWLAAHSLKIIADSPSSCSFQELLPEVFVTLEGEHSKSDVRQLGINIIRAWCVASYRRGASLDDGSVLCFRRAGTPLPTLFEARLQYAHLFVEERRPKTLSARKWLAKLEQKNKIPRHGVFREKLTRYRLSWRKDRRGRPRK